MNEAHDHIRWALMALYLVRNKLTAMGIDPKDTAMENLAAAEATLASILPADTLSASERQQLAAGVQGTQEGQR